MTRTQWLTRVGKPVVFLLALAPALLLGLDFVTDDLGANPIEEITHRTGRWGLRFLLIALAVTPLRIVTGWSQLVLLRRMLGLFAFFYVLLHFSTYIVLDQFFYLAGIVEDVAKRPYITVGFTSFLLLIPLAITSTNGWVKRLGGKRWTKLHKLAYVAATGGILHYLWLVKADSRDPVVYGTILLVLLGIRAWHNRFGGKRARVKRASAQLRTS